MQNPTENLDSPKNHDKTLMEWKTPEFIPFPRTKTWYIIAGSIALALIIYAVITGSLTMAIVFILIIALFLMTHTKEPRILDMKITEMGITYGNKIYNYNNINSFWIVYNPPYIRSLYLKLSEKTNKVIKIELDKTNPIEIRNLLSKEIPENEGAGERTLDLLIRILRLQ